MKYRFLLLLLLIFASSFSQNKNQSIGFKENKGQIIDQKGKANPAVKYLLNSNGLNVQLKKNGFSYDIYETKKHPVRHRIEEKRSFSSLDYNKEKTPDYTLEYVFHRIDIDFINSNPNVELVTIEASKDYDNYYNIPSKPEGVINVHQYQQITYKNIYPNIDVVFSIPKDSLKTVEYNFVVHPKGKISDIQMKFNGAKTELVDNKIQMNVRFGKMEETLPASWTEDGKEKKEITVGYKKIKNNIYGFETANAISDKTVIIDPVPVRLWGTYYGGNSNDRITKTSCDVNGNIFVSGETASSNNISTSGAFQQNINGSQPNTIGSDCFIAKFDSNGIRIWATYIGGNETEVIKDLAIDKFNNPIITGFTTSNINNFTSPGSYQPNLNYQYYSGNNYDAFLVKLDNNGQRIWGTLYGGTFNDVANSVTIDNNNDIIISGLTYSMTGITTIGAHKASFNNEYTTQYDAFIVKFSENGNRIWGTYYGGDMQEEIFESGCDALNNIYLVGRAYSINGISSTGAYQTDKKGENDSFLVKFSPNGNLIWGTYFGGENYDELSSIKVSKTNFIYVSGKTASNQNISTPNSFLSLSQHVSNGGFDGIIAKFDISGNRIWSTYFPEKINDLDIDNNDNIFFTGETTLNDGIATTNAFRNIQSFQDGYIQKFNSLGTRLWGTYYGGSSYEYTGSITFDKLNNYIYIGGYTLSYDGIATPISHQSTYSGMGYDGFLAKFQDCLSSPEISSNSPICIGNTIELKASGGTNYAWTGPNGFTSMEQNPTIPNATALNSGQYSCSITGTGGCDDTKIVDVIVGDIESPIPNLTSLPIVNGDCNTVITTIPTATDSCAGAITATTTNSISYNLPGTYTVVWNYNDGNGNTSTQNQTIIISNQPVPTSTSTQTFCIQQNAIISNIAITGQNIKWYNALTNGTLLSNTTPLQNGTTYYASQTISGCESERIPVLINIQNTSAPTGNTNQTLCSSQNPTLETIIISGNEIKWYNSAGILLSNSTSLQDGVTYYASQTENNCESPNKLAVTISLINTLPANNYEESLCDDLNDGSEKVNLSVYDSKLISNTSGYSFSYYSTFLGAENQLTGNQITNFSNYKLALGDNKIYVRINSNTTCYAIVALKLTLVAKPIITIPDVVPICENNSITIDAGLGFDTYLWSTGATTSTIVVANPGIYSVTVTTNYSAISCSSTKNFEVRKSNIATITAIETKDWTDNENIITVFASGEGDFEYSIDGIHFQDSNQFSALYSGEYTVHIRDKNGCGTATDEVFLLMYPKYFTPNGDGYNDNWNIKFSELETNLTVKIFDRYGKLIKELIQNNDWNGTMNGYALPADDYWFIATRTDGNEYKGHFSLKR